MVAVMVVEVLYRSWWVCGGGGTGDFASCGVWWMKAVVCVDGKGGTGDSGMWCWLHRSLGIIVVMVLVLETVVCGTGGGV